MSELREKIGKAQLRLLKVDCPEWPGCDVYVRAFPCSVVGEIQKKMAAVSDDDEEASVKVYCEIAALAVCDAKGVMTFEDVDDAMGEDFTAIQRCTEQALDFNGLSADSAEDIAKNSESPSDDTPSS